MCQSFSPLLSHLTDDYFSCLSPSCSLSSLFLLSFCPLIAKQLLFHNSKTVHSISINFLYYSGLTDVVHCETSATLTNGLDIPVHIRFEPQLRACWACWVCIKFIYRYVMFSVISQKLIFRHEFELKHIG